MSILSDRRSVRVFFALWPTVPECEQLAAWLVPLQRLYGGRAMRGETLHNTLVFIGEVEENRLEALQLAAQEVSAAAFELCFDEACYWEHNRIVYAAPSQVPQQMVQLVSALEQHLTTHRFRFDQRAYQPHVTLLRNAHQTEVPLPQMPPVCWQIGAFALMQSLQQDGLAGYRALTKFPLK
jgi:2'-5' RNA ligase